MLIHFMNCAVNVVLEAAYVNSAPIAPLPHVFSFSLPLDAPSRATTLEEKREH